MIQLELGLANEPDAVVRSGSAPGKAGSENAELTHASFFAGVGGFDLGLERAGWRTVAFSEIDPYASAVLAARWPDVPNLGDIVDLAAGQSGRVDARAVADLAESAELGGRVEPRDGAAAGVRDGSLVRASIRRLDEPERRHAPSGADAAYGHAALWTGGFPCQDLSVAGKRAGFAGSRSALAFAFLELMGRHRPRFVVLENVPGLLSSNRGRDFGTLLDRMVELGYGVAWRLLDARSFGVPQRRRRVFIVGDASGGRAGAERAAEVLSVGSRCGRHPPAGFEAWTDPAARAGIGLEIARPVVGTSGKRHDEDTDTLIAVRAPADAGRMRAADELAGGSYHRPRLDAFSVVPESGQGADLRASSVDLAPALTPTEFGKQTDRGIRVAGSDGGMIDDDELLPDGLDGHRYRCCGNGVVAEVAYWIGLRLAAEMTGEIAA